MGKQIILIGSDESYLTESVKILLADSCEVTARRSFAEFVCEASTGGFDAVIICGNCLAQPVICTGGLFENTVATIKAIKAASAVPVIALTSMPEWRESLLAAGADVCMNTPFEAPEFRDAALRCLSGVRPVGLSI